MSSRFYVKCILHCEKLPNLQHYMKILNARHSVETQHFVTPPLPMQFE